MNSELLCAEMAMYSSQIAASSIDAEHMCSNLPYGILELIQNSVMCHPDSSEKDIPVCVPD